MAIVTLPGWVTIDDTSPSIIYTGRWDSFNEGKVGGTSHGTDNSADFLTYAWEGGDIVLYGSQDVNKGDFSITIDTSPPEVLSGYSQSDQIGIPIYASKGLQRGNHSIVLLNKGRANGTVGASLDIDYLQYDSGNGTSSQTTFVQPTSSSSSSLASAISSTNSTTTTTPTSSTSSSSSQSNSSPRTASSSAGVTISADSAAGTNGLMGYDNHNNDKSGKSSGTTTGIIVGVVLGVVVLVAAGFGYRYYKKRKERRLMLEDQVSPRTSVWGIGARTSAWTDNGGRKSFMP